MKWLIILIISLISVPFLWTGISEIKNTIIEQKNAKKVKALVVGNSKQVGAGGEVYFAEIAFNSAAGQAIRFTDKVGSFPADYLAGDSVWVYYALKNPHDAAICSFKRTYLVPLIFITIGLLPWLIAIWLYKKLRF